MHRTATHLLTSPNAAQLEMRILANHGADKRFAFLRGRWSRAWQITKARIKLGMEAEKARSDQGNMVIEFAVRTAQVVVESKRYEIGAACWHVAHWQASRIICRLLSNALGCNKNIQAH